MIFFFLIQNPQLSHREKSRVHSIPLQLATEIHKAQGSPNPKLAPFPSSELRTLPLHSHTSKSVRRLPGTVATFQTFPGKGAALSFSFLLYPYVSVTRASPGIFKLQFIPGWTRDNTLLGDGGPGKASSRKTAWWIGLYSIISSPSPKPFCF